MIEPQCVTQLKGGMTAPTNARDVASLTSAIEAGQRPRWLHFWGHRPARDGSVTKSCFSQWWEGHPFDAGGVTYPTAEHYMMAEKARLFGDSAVAEQVIATPHPNAVKKLGRQVANFDEARWTAERFAIVVRGNHAKFGQHAELRAFLLGTGDRVLVEASPVDRIWGIGLAADDPAAEDPRRWRGLNLLGFALMEVRELLRG